MPDNTDTPNVLVLISDQHSKYHIGCYDDPLVRTPHLDALAARGVRLTNAYCASPLCVPSRMAFMTARTPSANGVWTNGHILSSAIPTWAHAIGASGYETALIGRMHFVGPDQRHGFEHRPLGEYMATHPGADRLGGPLLQKITGTTGQNRRAVECAGRGRTTYQAFDDRVVDATSAYLKQKADDPGSRPFAAVAGFLLPHCPFVAPRELFDYYYDRVDIPTQTGGDPSAVRHFKQLRGLLPPLDEERIRVARAAYFGMCEYLDGLIGEILKTLEETGLNRNTLVVYCSDHGEMAGEHGCWWKSNYYEGSVSVPIIASLPEVVSEGRSDTTLCNLIDLGPTFVEMAGAPPMSAADGRSLWNTLTDGVDPNRPDETFSEHLGGVDGTPSRMIRSGPWKLYKYHNNSPPVLHNLEEDPNENVDLGENPHYEKVRSELLDRLYDGWNPESILDESARLDRDYRAISNWGAAVQPPHEDSYPIPEGVEDVDVL